MVPTNVNEPFELIEYVLTKLFNASVATIRPCASKVNENGTGFAATVTVALDDKLPPNPTRRPRRSWSNSWSSR